MAFRFRMEKVLDHRQRILDEKSRAVGEAAREVSVLAARAQEIRRDISFLLAGGGETADPRQMRQRRLWLDFLDEILARCEEELARAESVLAERRKILTGAWRDREVLMKLKARQKENWEQEHRRRERRELDEIGQIRAERLGREKLAID